MSEMTKSAENYIGFEYKDVTVKRKMESVYTDGYPNFGWTITGVSFPIQSLNSVTMKLKRDRKIRNKAELSRLQRQFEAFAQEIERLEDTKSLGASVFAYVTGILGTGLIAGSVFSYMAGMLPLMILLAVPGFIGWIIPYFGYLRIQKKKIEQVAPLIDQKYDEIYEICEKAHELLA